jgi:thioredoxin-related protein
MKQTYLYRIFTRITIAMLLIANTTLAHAASIQWQSYSDKTFARAAAQNKLVFVYVKSKTCSWCAKMNNETFSSPGIISLINKKFIPVSVDVVSDAAIASRLHTNGTPTLIVINSSQHEISRLEGYQSVSELKSYLEGQ